MRRRQRTPPSVRLAPRPRSESPPAQLDPSTTIACCHAEPSASDLPRQPELIQTAACITLEVVQDFLGWRIRLDDGMRVIGPNVCGQQSPPPVLTNLPQRLENRSPDDGVQHIRGLAHPPGAGNRAPRIRFEHAASHQAVQPVDGTGLVSVQMRAVASERDQVPHPNLKKPLADARGSESANACRAATVRESVAF
jgi:hypothetical protein